MLKSKLTIGLAILACMVATLPGCTYLPQVVFANHSGSALYVQVQLGVLEEGTCAEPDIRLIRARHAKRVWRQRESLALPPALFEFEASACRFSATVPSGSALEVGIAQYFDWLGESSSQLNPLLEATLEGDQGSITVRGQMVARQFEEVGTARFVWEYGRT